MAEGLQLQPRGLDAGKQRGVERLAALQRSERRHAPLCAEPHAAERQSGIIRLPAHKGQNAHGSRGEGGGEIRFEAERPHLEIGMHGPAALR